MSARNLSPRGVAHDWVHPYDSQVVPGTRPGASLWPGSGSTSRRVSAAIEVLEVRRVAGGGNIRASVDVRAGGVTIRGAKIVQQPGQHPRLAMPDRQWTGADGKVRYAAVVELSAPLSRRVSGAVLAAWAAAHGDGTA